MIDNDKVQELQLRNTVIEATVELLNAYGAYLHTPTDSPDEDQMEAAMDERVTDLMKGGINGLGGHVMLALCAMMHATSDPEHVQNWLNDQSEQMLALVEELNAGD